MADPVVHFEIIGKDPARLRSYYRELFGWEAATGSAVAAEVSAPGTYGFIDKVAAPDGVGIPGGIGGGKDFESHTVFYVAVAQVGAALRKAEVLGGKRVFGPAQRPGGGLVVAQFRDPEGNLIGLAGPS